jgi:hypothetical protein
MTSNTERQPGASFNHSDIPLSFQWSRGPIIAERQRVKRKEYVNG